MERKKKVIDINEKTPLYLLSLPMFFELFLNILLNNVDTLMLSHYSDTAVGAVGNANQMMMFIILMFNIIATATSVVVAQYLGAKDIGHMNMIYTLAMVVNLVFGVVLSGIMVLGRNVFLDIMQVQPEMKKEASLYILIVGGLLFFQACYNVMLQILRCNGYTKVGMYVSIIMNIINIIGNYAFLYGPLKHYNLGVAGVAISTVVARGVALLVAITVFIKVKIGKISLKYIRPFPTTFLVQMLKIGLPTAGENMCYNMYQLVLMSFVNRMGQDAVNARIYCQSLIQFAMIFSNSQGMATQIITGHLVGAGKEDAAYKRVFKTLRSSLPITFCLATINMLISPFTIRIFTSNENIIKLGFTIMLVDVFLELGRCLNVTVGSSLKASGDYLYMFFVGVISMWGLGATVGYIMGLGIGLGVAGVYIGTATDECIRGIVLLYRWYKKKWYGKGIVEKKELS
ncbi:MAG: MATE family efflux transporter [Lachnospiraceae bacterium]|nr:MATE family efflux transporter [Lachnospiraceae bacterium]